MIKLGTRRNLIYPLIFSIFNGIRKIDSIIMKRYINYSGSTFLAFTISFSEFIAGLILCLINRKYIKNKEIASNFKRIQLIKAKSEISPLDSKIKIYILIIFSSYLGFSENIFSSYYIPDKFTRISHSLSFRLNSIIICLSGLFSHFILKISIFKHQIFSMIIIFICLIFTIIIEMQEYYKNHNKKKGLGYIVEVISLTLINDTFTSGYDIIEKYLLEYNFIYPFKLLMLEGLFGIIFVLLFTIYQDPFEQMKIMKKHHPEHLKYLSILLIIFFLVSCGRNVYRITTNKLFSPTAKALSDYIFVPILICISFAIDNDFSDGPHKSYFYFISNLVLSLIIVFCGIIYNEFIILFCCNLHYDTHIEVSKRSKIIDSSKSFNLSINDSLNDSSFYCKD